MRGFLILLAVLGLFGCAKSGDALGDAVDARHTQGVSMTLDTLDTIIRTLADPNSVERGPNWWQFSYRNVGISCITDERADRMRMIAPIVDLNRLPEGILPILMTANFHSALDARYATSDGVVFSAFIHPLSPLTTDQARSAIQQVASLVHTFGTTFSSTEMVFGAGEPMDN